MATRRKTGGVDAKYYERPSVIAKFEPLREALQQEFTREADFNITARDLAALSAALQQFQEDALGINVSRSLSSDLHPVRIPAKLFKLEDEENENVTNSALFHILKAAYQFRILNKWRRFDLSTEGSKREKNVELILYIHEALVDIGLIRVPKVFLTSWIAEDEQQTLIEYLERMGAHVTRNYDRATHVICPDDEESAQNDEEWLRTLEKKDGKVLVHWWYYPDSYDEWLPESGSFADPEPPPDHQGAWYVGLRWVRDSYRFNEWMNEEDYEVDRPEDLPEQQTQVSHQIGWQLQQLDDSEVSPAMAMDPEMAPPEEGAILLIQHENVKLVDLIKDAPKPGSRLRRYEYEPILYGVISNLPSENWNARNKAERITDSANVVNRMDIDTESEKLPNGDKNKISQELVVPSSASWFSSDAVHEVEKIALPQFFNGRSPFLTPDVYKQWRDYMIETYRNDPLQYLTLTTCRKHLQGDLFNISRVHAFLEQWGLINFQAEVEIDSPLPKSNSHSTDEERLYQQVYDAKTRVPLSNNDHSQNSNIRQYRCSTCSSDCTSTRYQSVWADGLWICADCFLDGRFSSNSGSGDFIKMEQSESASAGEDIWSDRETLRLLRAVEAHGDDWSLVAELVGRTQEECILRLLQLPIEDPFIGVGNDSGDGSEEEIVPFAMTDNPVMSLVGMLATAVNPGVAAAAAQRALMELTADGMEQIKEEPNGNFDFVKDTSDNVNIKKEKDESEEASVSREIFTESPAAIGTSQGAIPRELLQHATAEALKAAAEQAQLLATSEERELQRLVRTLIDNQLSKLTHKKEQLLEIDKSLEREHAELSRQREQLRADRLKMESNTANLQTKIGSENG
ncbi:uncharacterized protein VTP21DRAFT_1182 [Calcarisporiella thermophila]|uniref:uncharacterized protein n=1 Tax=Calcarisporiella thermophila TaxID=911321 RepID=UPI00374408D1